MPLSVTKQAYREILSGDPLPLGATPCEKGVNFSLFVDSAAVLLLLLFHRKNLRTPSHLIRLDPEKNRTGEVWHIFLSELSSDYLYGYRVYRKGEERGIEEKILLDPYAKGVVSPTSWGKGASFCRPQKGVLGEIVGEEPFDWQGDRPLHLPLSELIIYEMHVRGFTRHFSSGVNHPGSFLGIVEKIPYLLDLGINAVELLPIHEFFEWEYRGEREGELCNYWGYSPVNFFSICNRYCSEENFRKTREEFKFCVRELHRAGIEVLMDVVFNHTAEGNEWGPTLSFKGLGKEEYYLLNDRGEYENFSGCGNTVRTNHPIPKQLILDVLHYFVTQMHVDGFRFDLASIFTRRKGGQVWSTAPIIEEIAQDPILSQTKLIAEAWDAGGLYQVGSFPAYGRFAEWNGKYRDTIRRFVKGDSHQVGDLATRISGSEDLYATSKRKPYHSIHFVTSHDGFSLHDLVSYNEKHNQANGEDNQDGCNQNWSWNCGEEGESKEKDVLELRERQKRNFFLILLVSQGVPMICMGDEYGHTKEGNNNSWCHDSERNWFLWNALEKNRELFSFVSQMVTLRKRYSLFRKENFLKEEDIQWHGVHPFLPDWSESSRFLAYTICDPEKKEAFYIALNGSFQKVSPHLPPPPFGGHWSLLVDTSLPIEENFPRKRSAISSPTYSLFPYSASMLQVIFS